MQKNVLFIDTFHPILKNLLEENNVICVEGYQLTKSEALAIIKNFNGIAIRSRFLIDQDFIDHAAGISFIARGGAGMENIDTNAAAIAGITCLNAPEGNRDAVGEHAIGMLLALMNNLFRADAETRNGIWKREENRGHELKGKTIGIVGYGNMGSAFAKKLAGFDVKVLVYDKYIRIDTSNNAYIRQVEMDDLFQHTDILSLHVPLTEETKYIANDDFFAAFKKPIWFINTARGKILNTASLVNSLESGKVIAAALDVLEYESISFEELDASEFPVPFKYLINSDKVLLSPHIAGWTFESNEKIARVLAEKIIRLLQS